MSAILLSSRVKHYALRSYLFLAFALLLSFPFKGSAFHDGGVGRCEGCHTIHNSLGGVARTTKGGLVQFQAGPNLLQASDPSSACLNCHEKSGSTGPSSYLTSTASADMPAGSPPLQLAPGGDFGWLKKTYNWLGEGGPAISKGEHHGHNVVALNYGYVADSTRISAPGGDPFQYPSSQLSCISCHDPHGKYRRDSVGSIGTSGKPIRGSGSYDTSADPDAVAAVGAYRLLGGAGYQPKSLAGSYAFSHNPFLAAAPQTYNRAEDTSDVRVAYGNNASQWCANCHSLMHSSSGLSHYSDQQLGDAIASIYNSYIKTGDLTGTQATSYLSLVPFQMGTTTDMSVLKSAVNSTAGPLSTDRIMCLSCHRAHASGWDGMMRFPSVNFMTVDDGAGNPVYPNPAANPFEAMGRSAMEYQKALYDRPASKFAVYQRNLCNKCHAWD